MTGMHIFAISKLLSMPTRYTFKHFIWNSQSASTFLASGLESTFHWNMLLIAPSEGSSPIQGTFQPTCSTCCLQRGSIFSAKRDRLCWSWVPFYTLNGERSPVTLSLEKDQACSFVVSGSIVNGTHRCWAASMSWYSLFLCVYWSSWQYLGTFIRLGFPTLG